MQIVYFALTAIALYFFSDWLLDRIENALGQRLRYRNIIFFCIILGLALLVSRLVTALVNATG